jgi:hypothetical protein
VRPRTYLGRRGRLGSGGDGGRLDEVARSGGATPATVSRHYSPRGRRQAAPAASSPSCATPGRLLDDGEAATAKNGGGGELGFWRLGRGCSGAARVRARDPRGCGAA